MISSDDTEEWRPVPFPGFASLYEVSSRGRVRRAIDDRRRRFMAGMIIRPQTKASGYLQVGLRLDTHTKVYFHIHKLVLLAFVGPRPEGAVACHNDGTRNNNHFRNLRWDTPAGNAADMVRHGTRLSGPRHPGWKPKPPKRPRRVPRGIRFRNAKLTDEKVRDIRAKYAAGARQVDIAADFGVSQHLISLVVRREAWQHV